MLGASKIDEKASKEKSSQCGASKIRKKHLSIKCSRDRERGTTISPTITMQNTITPMGPTPLVDITHFEVKYIKFGPMETTKNHTKMMKVYYKEASVLVEPCLVTPKMRIPFEVKNYNKENEDPNYQLKLSLEHDQLLAWMQDLDNKVLAHVQAMQYPNQSIEAVKMLYTPVVKPHKTGDYAPLLSVKLLPKTKMENPITKTNLEFYTDLRKGDAYVKFAIKHIWILPNKTFGCMLHAVRIKYIPYVDELTKAANVPWVVPEEESFEHVKLENMVKSEEKLEYTVGHMVKPQFED